MIEGGEPIANEPKKHSVLSSKEFHVTFCEQILKGFCPHNQTCESIHSKKCVLI